MEKEESKREERKIGGYRVSDIICCLGKEKDYLRRFALIEDKRKAYNLAAALCGPYWLIYRIMVVEAIILAVIEYVCLEIIPIVVSVQYLYEMGPRSYYFMQIVCVVLYALIYFPMMGFFFDKIYWRRLKGLMDSYQCKEKEKDFQTQAELRRLGGCSVPMVIFFAVFNFMLHQLIKVITVRILLWGM